MNIYYLNSKGVEYISEITGISKENLKRGKSDGMDYVYVPSKSSGVDVLCNYPKDIVITVDKDDDIEDLRKKYNLKGNISIGDMFIVKTCEKYVVKPLDTFDKIVNTLGVDKEYIMKKNNLKTDRVFVGQILLI